MWITAFRVLYSHPHTPRVNTRFCLLQREQDMRMHMGGETRLHNTDLTRNIVLPLFHTLLSQLCNSSFHVFPPLFSLVVWLPLWLLPYSFTPSHLGCGCFFFFINSSSHIDVVFLFFVTFFLPNQCIPHSFMYLFFHSVPAVSPFSCYYRSYVMFLFFIYLFFKILIFNGLYSFWC